MVNAETIAPEDAFEQAVWEAPGICNSCFGLIRQDGQLRSGEHAHDKQPQTHRMAVTESGYQAVENPEISRYPATVACSQCGSLAGRAPEQPVSPSHWVSHSDRLGERLRNAGFNVSDKNLNRAIRLMYQNNPEVHGYPTRNVLRVAVKVAIEHTQ